MIVDLLASPADFAEDRRDLRIVVVVAAAAVVVVFAVVVVVVVDAAESG